MKTEQLIPLCRRYHAMLLHSDEQTISIAVVNTPPAELMEALRSATQKRIDIECWSQEQMDKRLQAQEKQAQLAQNDGPENIAERVNQILEQALRQRASDIHIEPTETHLRIRLRVDGCAPSRPTVAGSRTGRTGYRATQGPGQSRYRRAPFTAGWPVPSGILAGRPLSFRIATLPCRYGEKIVLRLLYQVDQALDLEHGTLILPAGGLSPGAEPAAGALLLVTGPTGSGKTVTLYSALQARNREQVNICSVEDPLEIPIAGMNQTQNESPRRTHFSQCAARPVTPGSGYCHGGRDPRCRRRNRAQSRPDRSSGAIHPAHQFHQ